MDQYIQICNTGLNNSDIKNAGKMFRHIKESLIVMELSDDTLPETDQFLKFIHEMGCSLGIAVLEHADEVQVYCISNTDEIRALEYIEYIFGQFGINKGDAKLAKGTMSAVLLHVLMSELEMKDVLEYFMAKANSYFNRCKLVEALTYEKENPDKVALMETYHKRQVTWAYVRTKDIAPTGEKICLKTLENDTGVMIEVRDDIYIMIGCLGEVYEISREKFEASYEKSEQPLDIFTQLLNFIPSVELPRKELYLPIDELAHLCYPKPGNGILAEKLTERTKVYGKNGRDYFVGNPGDYMAIRCDDHQDIYIIKKEVFHRTYEK